jgi:hypothetical protein
LLVSSSQVLENKVVLAARLAAGAERILEGRRVDVLILDPETVVEPVHLEARKNGMV